jgi:hypothetical protein
MWNALLASMDIPTKPRRRFPMEGWALSLEYEGMVASLVAGTIFGALEVLGAIVTQAAPLRPIEAAASLLIRERAYLAEYLPLSIPLGIAVHFSLATLYGYAFGLMSTEARMRTRLNFAREAVLGFGFGLLIWAVNFVVIARGLYPWLRGDLLAQALPHGIGFGLPLSLLFSRKERRRVVRTGPP